MVHKAKLDGAQLLNRHCLVEPITVGCESADDVTDSVTVSELLILAVTSMMMKNFFTGRRFDVRRDQVLARQCCMHVNFGVHSTEHLTGSWNRPI
jgi:hypothetical protein